MMSFMSVCSGGMRTQDYDTSLDVLNILSESIVTVDILKVCVDLLMLLKVQKLVFSGYALYLFCCSNCTCFSFVITTVIEDWNHCVQVSET